MTQQETEEMAAKLPLIWLQEGVWSEALQWTHEKSDINWSVLVADDVEFKIVDFYRNNGIFFTLQRRQGNTVIGRLLCTEDGSLYETPVLIDDQGQTDWASFVAQWMPFFRRGCWLSGLPIDCSAHEQLEWTLWMRERESEWTIWNEQKIPEQTSSWSSYISGTVVLQIRTILQRLGLG